MLNGDDGKIPSAADSGRLDCRRGRRRQDQCRPGCRHRSGGNGNDDLLGGGGRDLILGDGGNDYLNGNGGRDTLAGNEGDDDYSDSEVTAGGQVDDDFLPDNYPFDFEDRDNIFNDDDGDNLINTVV
ncbi:MAG: hypothetical protein Ct9H300mP1_26750 [Planctomycetaceae bacterium]|nr:MAG: hypothetical protein Ct9H300mP1_26750 [Planctomycetaceae bacterium]